MVNTKGEEMVPVGNRWYVILVLGVLVHGMAMAQETTVQSQANIERRLQDQVMSYEADYFSRYQPRTALGMVRQVPGFLLDNGDNTRGFGAAAGNVLINGRRASAKQNTSSQFLSRIAASQVERIELIRGQTPGIDMLGHSTLVNIILQGDFPAVVRWETSLRHNNRGPIKPAVDISLTDRWREIDYTAGFYSEREANGENGFRQFTDENGLLFQTSDVRQKSTGVEVRGTLSASTWLGETLLNVNTKVSSDSRGPRQRALITPVDTPTSVRQEFIDDDLVIKGLEFGIDAVRNLKDDLLGKAIVLFFNRQIPKVSTRRLVNAAGNQTLLRTADTDTDTTEGIARLEFNWSALPDHTIQLNLEAAYNEVNGSLLQTDDTGTGPVVVNVQGANTIVDEIRWDILLRDNWLIGNFEFDYGLGVEYSTISQSGDNEQKRSFNFLKPRGIVTWSAGQGQQVRLRVEREVAQRFHQYHRVR